MKKYVFLLLLSGCTIADNKDYEKGNLEKVWVCHNPESSNHGTACHRTTDVVRGEHETCYWELDGSNYGRGHRNEGAFCWLLEKEDCEEIQFEWQKRNCHLLSL